MDNREYNTCPLTTDDREQFITDNQEAFNYGDHEELNSTRYEVVSGPRTSGDGYFENYVVAIEGNQIEITE